MPFSKETVGGYLSFNCYSHEEGSNYAYVVAPVNDSTIKIGDFAVVLDHSTGRYVTAVVADRGHDYNEVSLKVAWDLGYSASGLYGPAGDFETIYFPNTRINWLGSIEGYFDALDYFVSQYY